MAVDKATLIDILRTTAKDIEAFQEEGKRIANNPSLAYGLKPYIPAVGPAILRHLSNLIEKEQEGQ